MAYFKAEHQIIDKFEAEFKKYIQMFSDSPTLESYTQEIDFLVKSFMLLNSQGIPVTENFMKSIEEWVINFFLL